MKRAYLYLGALALALAILTWYADIEYLLWRVNRPASNQGEYLQRTTPDLSAPERLLCAEDMDGFAALLNALWTETAAPPVEAALRDRLDFPAQALYLAPRSQGRRPLEIWVTEGSTADALAQAVEKARQNLSADEFAAIDTLEIALGHSFEERYPDQPDSARNLFSNIHRGIRGLEISFQGGITQRYSPTYAVASNRSNSRLIELFCDEYGISDDLFRRKARLFTFEAEQVLVKLGDQPRAVLMERGNTYVDPASLSRDSTAQMAHLAGSWLINNIHEDGRMTYKYWPSSASESTANNMIRQWMATVALIRCGKAQESREIIDLAAKNIDYNLAHYYREDNGYGLIFCRDQVKLGALALAALALLEHPDRQRWAEQEKALQKTIDSLWNEDGSLTSFFIPAGDMRFQNFYPGEALLYWAFLYEKEPDPQLLDRFMKSFQYYRRWHLKPENRNPAFIPWHTQAYYIIWQITGEEALKDFIFEMNDWLLPVQQWPEEPPYRDIMGRFYDPGRPFGPPHSSATGVYLEGLIDAFALARENGDRQRMEAYRKAINRGLRSVIQLQFAAEVDMYYVSPPMLNFVKGGIRTTVYDNEIRCDNVQHNYMAALKILKIFEDEDFYRF